VENPDEIKMGEKENRIFILSLDEGWVQIFLPGNGGKNLSK
jgi:hypothetical protein